MRDINIIILVNIALIIASSFCTLVISLPTPPFSCDPTISSTKSYPFCNFSLPITERVHDLVSRLSLDEKISQLVNNASAIPRLGIPHYQWWSEALHGVAVATGVENGISFNGSVRAATSFPQVILTAATFDPNLWYQIAKVIGTEARGIYNAGDAIGMTFWSPNINIFRDPRWGRGQETPGEDPVLTSKYAVLFVRGIQGDHFQGGDLKDGHLQVSACCKHFTAYDLENWNGVNRFTFDAQVTKQDMEDTYQLPFKKCVEAKATGIMCAYNLVNGVPNCANHDLLTKTAREEWGFQGYITSDCDAVSLIYEKQKYAQSPEDAVAYVLKAGMDVNCGTYLANHTSSAVKKGKVSESDIDRALYNLFSVRMRLGLFNGNPSELPYGNITRKNICTKEHQDLALEAARHGIVLLKNSANLLPLSKSKTKSLAVIGPNANDTKTLLGNYAGPPCKTITPLKGLTSYVAQTTFQQGCNTINCTSLTNTDETIRLAKSADYVVLVMGLNQHREKEELDRENLVLPGEQQSLIMSVAKAAKNPVVLVLLCGGPVDISFAKSEPKIGGILWAGYPGQAGGQAIANIIFGDHNPGGRLPMTWYPNDFIKIPMTDMRMRPDSSTGYPGRTYRFYQGEKVFEFGYGLSYSNYSYKFASVSQTKLEFSNRSSSTGNYSVYIPVSEIDPELCEKAKFSAVVRVGNEGVMMGKHPVLLFLKPRNKTDHGNLIKQLVGFQTVSLEANKKANVEFQVNPCEDFGRASEDGIMMIESGVYYLVVEDQEYLITINAEQKN